MIPMAPTERLSWVDENDGVKYLFKTFTGENEVELFDIIGSGSKDQTQEQQRGYLDKVIDFCLVGWEAVDPKIVLPEFPEKPSKYFKIADKNTLIEKAFGLNRLGAQEIKN